MSVRYHRARFPHTLHSTLEFLKEWKPNPHDEALDDPISWLTQQDHFEGARFGIIEYNPPETEVKLLKLEHIMEHVPIVCRAITIKTNAFGCTRMNPWLGCVQSLPAIMRYMSTADYLRFKDKKQSGELFNCAMLVTKHPGGSILGLGAGKHISSFLLSGDPSLYHPDADLATWAMVVVYINTQESRQAWMLDDLRTIDAMHSAIYRDNRSSWTQYLYQVAGQDFRLALVTQSSKLQPWCQCPHLNKFMLACYFLRDKLNAEEMRARRDAAIQDFYGRVYKPELLVYLFRGKFDVTVKNILARVPFVLKPTLRETVKDFTAKVNAIHWKCLEVELIEPSQETVSTEYQNLNCQLMVSFFKTLCPAIADLDHATWLRLFTTGICLQDSYKRNTVVNFEIRREKLVRDVRLELEHYACFKVPVHVYTRFWEARGYKEREFSDSLDREDFKDHWYDITKTMFAELNSATTCSGKCPATSLLSSSLSCWLATLTCRSS